jgi:DNA-binding NtrC family response regulator
MPVQKILIIDDEPAIRTLLRCALAAPGFRVFEADCGANALAIAAEQAPFALVVSDILMPGMDGIALAKILAREGLADRFLFISGFCDGGAIPESGREFPTAAFLAKPFSISELLTAFHEVMAEQPQAIREASHREQRKSSAMRRPAAPIDAVRALRRKARRLWAQGDELVQQTVWGLRTHALLMQQIASQVAAIEAICHRGSTRRAML